MTAGRRGDDAVTPERQSPSWLRLLTIAAVAVPLAWLAGAQASGIALARFNPPAAVKAAPNNGEALAREAELELTSAVQAAGGEIPPAIVEPLWRKAREAFLRAPLSVRSIRIAALTREAAGDQELARSLMHDLVKLSKRDLMSHLWLIGDYGGLGDLEGVLHHYDVALRTSSQAPGILLPRLALALQAPGAIDALTQVLARQPSWAPRFWRTIYVTPEALPKATELRLALLERGIPVPDDVDRRLILSLGRDREWDIAASLYRRVAGHDAPALDRIGEADLSRIPKLPPIEWTSPSTGLQSAEFDAKGGRMILSGGAGSSGIAASRVVALEPGSYEVRVERADSDMGNEATLAVEVVCVETTPQLQIARFRGEGSTVDGAFVTDAGCRYYSVQVQLDVPRDSISGQVVIDEIALRPV